MSRVAVLACAVVLTACGRLGFDGDGKRDGGGSGSGSSDGAIVDGGFVAMQQVYVKASNADAGDEFGESVALSRDGNTLAVGAPLESSSATTINGDGADNSALEAGAVYVFRRSGTTWAQEAYIKASNAEAGDQLGWSVALSADGSTLVAGARHEDSAGVGPGAIQTSNAALSSGAAYVFTRSGTAWSQQEYLKASNTEAGDAFGERVAISDDGNTVVVGAPTEDSSAAQVNGNQANNTAVDSGAAYVFTRSGTTWTQQEYIKPTNTDAGDWFGYKVALSGSGDLLVVGAYREDSAATGIDGNIADNSLTNSGAVYLFARTGTAWSQVAYVKASNTGNGDNFGYGVVASGDGALVAVTAEGEASGTGDPADNSVLDSGAVYAFRSGPWMQSSYLKAINEDSGDQLGFCVGTTTTGDVIVAGAPYEASSATGIDGNTMDNSLVDAGAVYMWSTTGAFSQRYIKATNTGAGDNFGWGCAVSGAGDVLVVSAPFEDGVNDAAADSGAAYLYY